MPPTYRLALVGFGSVNRALARMIADDGGRMGERLGFRLSIVAVSDLLLGSAHDAGGLDLAELTALPAEQGALASVQGGRAEADNEALIKNSSVDIVAEATFTDARTGEPRGNPLPVGARRRQACRHDQQGPCRVPRRGVARARRRTRRFLRH